MGQAEQQKFKDAVAAADSAWILKDWKPAVRALSQLTMSEMCPALAAITDDQRGAIWQQALFMGSSMGDQVSRISFAMIVVNSREITDLGIPDQINDGREFLGCTRLDDGGVRFLIDGAMNEAQAAIQNRNPDTEGAANTCCGVVKVAWYPVLVRKRQSAGASLNSNMAAAAHYMLSRYHVCAALATRAQMKIVIDGYDAKKRAVIALGDRQMRSMGVTDNPPFPPAFAITKWAYKGTDDGEADRIRCNANADLPVIPRVGGGIQ